jgi:hypothetical protein
MSTRVRPPAKHDAFAFLLDSAHRPPAKCHDAIVFITMYTCTRRCPKCQPPRLVTRPLGPSVQASRLPFTTPSPSARHVLLDFHLAVDYRLRAPHLHTTRQETCTHSFRHGRVSHHSTYFMDHIDNHSSQNEHTRVLVNLVFALPVCSLEVQCMFQSPVHHSSHACARCRHWLWQPLLPAPLIHLV